MAGRRRGEQDLENLNFRDSMGLKKPALRADGSVATGCLGLDAVGTGFSFIDNHRGSGAYSEQRLSKGETKLLLLTAACLESSTMQALHDSLASHPPNTPGCIPWRKDSPMSPSYWVREGVRN